jgi:epsilon-lactone hydrolase
MIRWDVDDRPATPYTRAYVAAMWLRRDKRAFEGAEHTLEVAGSKQARGSAPPRPWTRLRRQVRWGRVARMTEWVVRPRGARPRVRVVYLHGGGYVHPLTADYWRLVDALSDHRSPAPTEVVVPDYPLAPRATVDDVLPRLVELVRRLDAEDGGLPTVLMGDSAGGALAVSVAAALRNDVRPPIGVVLLSPWLDAALDESEVADLEASDPMLAETGLRAAGRWWAGERSPDDALVSPVGADLTGLPPIELFTGQRDILWPAVDRFVARAGRDGVDLRVHELSAMFHVWMTRAVPEAARTRRQLRDLLADRVREQMGPGLTCAGGFRGLDERYRWSISRKAGPP